MGQTGLLLCVTWGGEEWVNAVEEKVELASVTQLNTSVSALGRERNGIIWQSFKRNNRRTSEERLFQYYFHVVTADSIPQDFAILEPFPTCMHYNHYGGIYHS